AAFSQFASDLDEVTRKQLERGKRVTELMKQKQFKPLSVTEMSLSLTAANEGYLDDIPVDKINDFETALHDYAATNAKDLAEKIGDNGNFNDEIAAQLKQVIETFKAKGVY
ncbi:MAG: F0F1 ATP synthase subunit alpha, partial [Halothiobacillus sp.]|nr:F0F1 ATP synthase subunit alpha [Halothiobacillus sp.]